MRAATNHRIHLGHRRIQYRIVRSRAAAKLRVRVGPNGVEVVQPAACDGQDVSTFLRRNEAWILNQLQRAERLHRVRRPRARPAGEILFRGEPVQVCIQAKRSWARTTSIAVADGQIVIRRGRAARTVISRSLERWLRREARREIARHLAAVTARLGREPDRVYVMGQRTKWGNCSARGNLSFNWRLILAPDSVLRYIVTHEAVHLAVPDHSRKFWFTVQSLCPDTERARQWLTRHQGQLTVDLDLVLRGAAASQQQPRGLP